MTLAHIMLWLHGTTQYTLLKPKLGYYSKGGAIQNCQISIIMPKRYFYSLTKLMNEVALSFVLMGTSKVGDVILVQKNATEPLVSATNDYARLKDIGVTTLHRDFAERRIVTGNVIVRGKVKGKGKGKGKGKEQDENKDKDKSNDGSQQTSNGAQATSTGIGHSNGTGGEPPDDPYSFQEKLKTDGLEQRDLLIVILRHLLGTITNIKAGDIDELERRIKLLIRVLGRVGADEYPIKNLEKTIQYYLSSYLKSIELSDDLDVFFKKNRDGIADLERSNFGAIRNFLIISICYYINPLTSSDVTTKLIRELESIDELRHVVSTATEEHKSNVKAKAAVNQAAIDRADKESQAKDAPNPAYLAARMARSGAGSRRRALSGTLSRRVSIRKNLLRQQVQQTGNQATDGPASNSDTYSIHSTDSGVSITPSLASLDLEFTVNDPSLTISEAGGEPQFLKTLLKRFVTRGNPNEICGAPEGSAIFILLAESMTLQQLHSLIQILDVGVGRDASTLYNGTDEFLLRYAMLVDAYSRYINKSGTNRRSRFIRKLTKVLGSDFSTFIGRLEMEYNASALANHSYQIRLINSQMAIEEEETETLRRRVTTRSGMLSTLLSNLHDSHNTSHPFEESVMHTIFVHLTEQTFYALEGRLNARAHVFSPTPEMNIGSFHMILDNHFGINALPTLEVAGSSSAPLQSFVNALAEILDDTAADRLIDALPDSRNVRGLRRPRRRLDSEATP